MDKTPKGLFGVFLACLLILIGVTGAQEDYGCPEQEKIAPCRCSTRDMEYQIWCSHSELPKVLEGISAVSRYISRPIDELILENNNLPSLPGKVFTSLRVLRLMLRHNHLERVSSGWLEGLHDSLLELFLVEPDLRSLPIDSLDNLQGLEAITLQSRSIKRLPRFSGLMKLRYLQINSRALIELSPPNFRHLPNLEQLHVFGSPKLVRLEAGLFRSLPKLSLINITDSGVTWIHPRAFVDLAKLNEISLVGNNLPEASILGRAVVDIPLLSTIRLDANRISHLQEKSFTDLPFLSRLSLSKNSIVEISAGAFQRLPQLRVLDLNHNLINRIHPEFFIQRTGSGLEELSIINNHLSHADELRSILGALPRLKILDASHNQFQEIPFGALRGHPTLERLHLDDNRLTFLERETFSAMPALRELRLKNNSLTNMLEAPFWNLPGLKGLDLSDNYFKRVEPILLANIPNLRRLDLSGNGITVVEPDSFINIPSLEHLNLSRNAISGVHSMTMGHLTALYELDIGWNRLLEVIPGLPKNIEHLHLAMNRIIMLPTIESQDLALPALRTADFSANGIDRILPATLSELPNLRTLHLGYNSLRILEDGTFDGLARLEQLDLRYNRLMSLHGRSFKPLRSLTDLNLRGNRLEMIRADIFADNFQLQRVDLARNNLAQIPHSAFSSTRDLRELYASHNTLTQLPGSLHGLAALEVLDLSFNNLNILSPATLSSLTSLLELRLVRNKIKELREGAFSRLPRLSFIDLESNDLRIIERNAVRNLPELQAIRLGKNRIQMIPSGAFTDLPLLQTAELQENRIREIANNAFINVPHILFLNLSYNLLPSLEHAGLASLRSLEVLDVSKNRLTGVTMDSLATLEWLVELKMDQNRICGIQGLPFDNMSRLRVLSMRKNRMTSVPENAFKRLRSNIAVLDIDENPLACSCGMIWLRGWLQQGSSEGPRCADGTLFREMRLTRQDCISRKYVESVHPGCEAEIIYQTTGSSFFGENASTSWMNFQNASKFANTPEDYMYDDYPDYKFDNMSDQTTSKDSTKSSTMSPNTLNANIQTGTVAFSRPSSTSTLNSQMQVPSKKKTPMIPPSPSSSGFTFFGVPLPNLNFNLWGNSSKKSQRKEESRPSRGRYRTFPPSEPDIQKGGFHPLPRPQSGFIPITDPKFTVENLKLKDMTNVTIQTVNRTAIVTRVFNPPGRKKTFNPSQLSSLLSSSSPPSLSSSRSHLLSHAETTTLKTTRDSPSTTSTPNGIKIFTSTTPINFTIPPDLQIPSDSSNKSISISTQAYNGEHLDVNSEASTFVEGNSANLPSQIVWTTRTVNDTLKSTTTTESIYHISDKNNLFEPKDHTSLINPEETTPMGPEDQVIYVTTEHYNEDKIRNIVNGRERFYGQNNKEMEASALSAFLVPGGQVELTPQIYARTLGRSTIEKVTLPHLENQSQSNKYKSNEPYVKADLEVNEGELEETRDSNGSDDPFNWYFQNYNDTNLEPFVGVAYSGNNTSNSDNLFISMILVVGGLFISVKGFI
ncbi:chaoptin [Fopius arisanus]|uniref:Chaoptin n=2 Tax=Fopius arisanus TaxID=64838 RepID=A0A9R1TJ59_9HYME|nr:PREDICTED: chaoptin [Fopius arisanus]XP_011310140.1 PREDICTED: chaoptin [Fopius arisanus]